MNLENLVFMVFINSFIIDDEEVVKSSRNRLTLITCIAKIIFTLIFTFALNFFLNVTESGDPLTTIYYGFQHFTDDFQKMVHFFLQVGSIRFCDWRN